MAGEAGGEHRIVLAGGGWPTAKAMPVAQPEMPQRIGFLKGKMAVPDGVLDGQDEVILEMFGLKDP